MKSSKFQAPSSNETSNTKHQSQVAARHWSLKLGGSLVLAACCWALLLATSAHAQRYSIDWFTVDGGGGTSTGGVYQVSGTVGQPDAWPTMSGGNYSVDGGFWSIIAAVQTPGAPSLSITLTSTNTVLLSWPSPSTGFALQQNTNSLASVNWSNVSATIQDNGTIKYVIVNPSSANRFYRLLKFNAPLL